MNHATVPANRTGKLTTLSRSAASMGEATDPRRCPRARPGDLTLCTRMAEPPTPVSCRRIASGKLTTRSSVARMGRANYSRYSVRPSDDTSLV